MFESIQNPLITALASAGIFLVVLILQLDFFFMFLSTLPLFSVGLSKDPKIILKASILAAAPIIMLTSSLFPAILFLLIFAFPCWYMCHTLRKYYKVNFGSNVPTLRLWYPVGLSLVSMALYGCVLLAVITAYFATQNTNLPQELTHIIQNEINNLSKDYEIKLRMSPQNLPFILCGFLTWVWAMLLLAHAWFVNNALVRKNIAKRPHLTITPFFIPYWLLALMSISALASLIGGESMRFLGKSTLLILLLPYFFLGISMLHEKIRDWPNKGFFMFFIYLSMIVFLWPALVVAAAGLFHHIKTFNKHLSSGGNSFRN